MMTVQVGLARLSDAARDGSLARACDDLGIALLVLHGSGVSRPESAHDIDLAFSSCGGGAVDELAIHDRFSALFAGDHLDLMALDRADPVARFAALQRGELLFESRPHLFAEAHVAAAAMYRDTQWMRDRALERL